MGNLWYLALAYGVIWVVLLVYLYSIARRQESLRQEVKAIEEALEAESEAEDESEEAKPFLTLVQTDRAPSEGPARARRAGRARRDSP
jgi:CcmD family protein